MKMAGHGRSTLNTLVDAPLRDEDTNLASPAVRSEAIVLANPLWESVTDESNASDESCPKRPRLSLNLMHENVFAYFQALDSGLLVGSQSTCSLNCGGQCDECKANAQLLQTE